MRSERSVSDGYVLFSPLLSTTTYLIDRDGAVVHTWESELAPGVSVYLLDNGHLLRCGREPGGPFRGGGHGGRIQEFTWDGELVWDFKLASERMLQHHDIEPLPNGNVLAIVWEFKTTDEAIVAGRDPAWLGRRGLWPDAILEIEPRPPDGGRIVWEWHAWDHLVQDFDRARDNYGGPAAHPERIDIHGDREPRPMSHEEFRRLQALGYMSADTAPDDLRADFLHSNSIAYNARLDQIALTVYRFSEVWIIDHGTTTGEAAGHTGGRHGRGGDLLYRWGNPWAYRAGTADDQRLFVPHDARWIPEGSPGAGNLLIFNNGDGRPGGDYSSVVEIAPPVDAEGRYSMPASAQDDPAAPGGAALQARFGPDEPVWEYRLPDQHYADFISGAERLPNGNTLICSGPRGHFLEVTPQGEIVWEYRNPFSGDAPNPAGDPPYSVFRATPIPRDHPALAPR